MFNDIKAKFIALPIMPKVALVLIVVIIIGGLLTQ